MSLASITDKAPYREGLPKTLAVDYIPFYDKKIQKVSKKHALHWID